MESPAVETALRWIVLTPLLSAAIIGLAGRRIPQRAVGLLACAAVGLPLALAVKTFVRLTGMAPDARLLTDAVAPWIAVGKLRADIGFACDPLGAVMILVVTGVGFLIHVYSIGYMGHDPGFRRFFAYLNLFVFAMLTLVLADNLILLFLGWEGVGLCSYLLIGFWFNEEQNAAAGKKAFIVNRIGDFGFLCALFLVAATLLPHLTAGESPFAFATLRSHLGLLGSVATALGLLFFLGVAGKSAQIPLYIWLPDAMAGPTPVSALIHAATMVTAGVYLMARLNFIYVLSPVAMAIVAAVGAVTALVAASIGLAQNDIKKVLAYSTVSQLGYMVMACGVGAFAAGIFHLMTHAFFKALLFLGSGSVIHAMSGEQDMRVMGGLRGKMRVTYATFAVGTLAIAGIFPFAGFFSKDEVLWKAFSEAGGGLQFWAVGFLAAGLTAFYMARLFTLTFLGENRASDHVRRHIHESPRTMTVPLIVLAVLSLVGGWIGWPHFLGGANHFETWLAPVFHAESQVVAHVAGEHAAGAVVSAHGARAAQEFGLAGASLLWAALGLALGWWVYGRRPSLAEGWRRSAGGIPHRILANKYYVDELYEAAVIRPGYALSRRILWKWVDVGVIDGLIVNGSAVAVAITGAVLRLFQNGLVRFYAWAVAFGAAVFVVYLTVRS